MIDMSEAKAETKREKERKSNRLVEDVFMVVSGEEIEEMGAGEVVRGECYPVPVGM